MTRRLHPLACCGAALLLCGPGAQAYDKARPPMVAASHPMMVRPAPPAKRIDINSASRAELKTLPGIGDVEADKIIAARPYPSKAKLLANKVLPDDKYAALQGHIVAAQRETPRTPVAGSAHGKASAKP